MTVKRINDWKVNEIKKVTSNKSTFFVGLPGIGNVGKIVADFLIDELKANKIMDFFSYKFPNTVLVNESNLLSFPKIELYYKKIKSKDYFILTGDLQPTSEESCFNFCEIIDDICKKNKCQNIITMGGIGLQEEPDKPKIYITGNDKKTIDDFTKGTTIKKKIFGVVGPIMGVSGVLPGISKIKSLILLSETMGSQMHVGIKGSKEIIKVLNKKYDFKIDIKKLNKEIKEIEEEKIEQTQKLTGEEPEANYFG
ncbi:PAC2 family protein [Candidatus Woesearchaeota archaeon]|nr:PAC2 family protein [Candidatus Woesearchaeota archaeon]